ncbi:MAG: Alternative dihydrofolate reductase 2 / Dihydropteroate synthase (EC [uncultured Sulfurovum sp.]|uniref:dihydropteroate synthase n=1 Tax=uncultured Sulfurovum sp. TaxID=269237 RepID=A0A6S6S740_9BACT|nr:MAG: Alternative dihydrofolate reductase 2 / Dihydropteroate synthase (EC [uncultured Sulfurovum sp.]
MEELCVHVYRLGTMFDKKEALKTLGVESGGVGIMAKKMELLYFFIKDLKCPAANILKQDALSIGADLAVPGGVILCEKEVYDCILIGTRKHMEILSKKELAQPFGLKVVASELQKFLKTKEHSRQIMGVINANDDSFFEGSRFLENDAILKIKQMLDEGADIVDIGAVSSRPGAKTVSELVEFERMKPICDAVSTEKLFQKATFSVDSYTPEVVEYALNSGFRLINDITGASDEAIIKLAVKYDVKLCIMHMQGTPQTMQNNPQYDDVMVEVSQFFEERISRCEALGMKRENIILDVGLGFGKSLEHNLTLIKNMAHFKVFGCEVLVGASRKSMIDKIVSSKPEERLPGTLAIHLKAIENGASIVRCHDVKEHVQALAVWEKLQ